MKRSKSSSRAMRQRTTAEVHSKGQSRYAQKSRSGKQMYGPGCCANDGGVRV